MENQIPPSPNHKEEFEYELLQSQESLQFALQSGRMGTWDFDIESNSVTCSPEMLQLWGVSNEEFKNQRSILQSKVHPEDIQKMIQAIDKAIEERTIYELEYRIIPSPGEERWVLSRGRCKYGPNSTAPIRFAGIVHDITNRKTKEIELANAVQARNEFFMIAGHELKTPLTCLQLQIQVMQWQIKDISSGSASPELIEVGLQRQLEHLSRISRLVDNILDETKISEGRLSLQLETFDLTDMVSKVLQNIGITAETARVEIKFTTSQSVIGSWDRFRLEQVLFNLLMNAIRYGDKKPVQVEVIKDGNNALLIVRDQGAGIKPEDQSRIFQRFERASSSTGIHGMGLGLFISNNIVSAHGGVITVKSERGRGAEFSVSLPCNF